MRKITPPSGGKHRTGIKKEKERKKKSNKTIDDKRASTRSPCNRTEEGRRFSPRGGRFGQKVELRKRRRTLVGRQCQKTLRGARPGREKRARRKREKAPKNPLQKKGLEKKPRGGWDQKKGHEKKRQEPGKPNAKKLPAAGEICTRP